MANSGNLPRLLSKEFEAGGNFVPQDVVDEYLRVASSLMLLTSLNEDERKWLFDFSSTMPLVLKAERDLNSMVNRRAAGNTAPEKALPQVPAPNHNGSEALYDDPSFESKTETRIKLNELVQRPDVFDGKQSNARRWIEDFEAAAEANDWTENVKIKYISAFLGRSKWKGTVAIRLASV